MGNNTREIRRRIKSSKNMQQITKAMKMVAAAKLRRAQTGVVAARPYTRKLNEVLGNLSTGEVSHPYMQAREVKKVGYVVIAGNRGLCGGFNVNVFKRLEEAAAGQTNPYALVVVGNKTRDYFKRRSVEITSQFMNIGDNPSFGQAKELAREISQLYTSEVFDEIYLVYTEFISAMSQNTVCKKLLPITDGVESAAGGNQDSATDYIFEPGEEELIETLMPQYLDVTVYTSLLEAKASEHGARMTAMSSATENAAEVIRKLTLSLNRARQAAITTEISEIVSGADALA